MATRMGGMLQYKWEAYRNANGRSTESLAHQNRTIAIASAFRVDGAKSPEILQKQGVLGSEIAAQIANR